MGPSTMEALAILVVAFVPGAAYVWAFERQAGPYGVTLADRMMRFLAARTGEQCSQCRPRRKVEHDPRPTCPVERSGTWACPVERSGTRVRARYA